MGRTTQAAVFGSGCFWCTEAIFASLRGVISVMPGYAGGSTLRPTYEQVCTGTTGHAEVVKIEFDPAQITFRNLLEVFSRCTIPPRAIGRARMWVSSTAR